MMKCDDYRQFYHWRIVCEHGVITDADIKGKTDAPDPQNPPAEYGQASSIELEPQKNYLHKVIVPVPPNCLPVCHARVTQQFVGQQPGELTGLHFQVGWNHKGTRCMIDIDCTTGDEVMILDQRGCKV